MTHPSPLKTLEKRGGSAINCKPGSQVTGGATQAREVAGGRRARFGLGEVEESRGPGQAGCSPGTPPCPALALKEAWAVGCVFWDDYN